MNVDNLPQYARRLHQENKGAVILVVILLGIFVAALIGIAVVMLLYWSNAMGQETTSTTVTGLGALGTIIAALAAAVAAAIAAYAAFQNRIMAQASITSAQATAQTADTMFRQWQEAESAKKRDERQRIIGMLTALAAELGAIRGHYREGTILIHDLPIWGGLRVPVSTLDPDVALAMFIVENRVRENADFLNGNRPTWFEFIGGTDDPQEKAKRSGGVKALLIKHYAPDLAHFNAALAAIDRSLSRLGHRRSLGIQIREEEITLRPEGETYVEPSEEM